MTTDARTAAIASVLESVVQLQRHLADSRATPFGGVRLTRSQVDALFLLVHGPDHMSPGSLASALGITPGAVTQLVDGLRAAGLVEQSVDPVDARSRRLRLTQAAAQQVRAFEAQVVVRLARRFDGLSDEELRTAARLLAKVVTP